MLVGMAQSWVKLADQAATISGPAERAGGQGSRGCRLGNRYPRRSDRFWQWTRRC